jgi:hypothetical protein
LGRADEGFCSTTGRLAANEVAVEEVPETFSPDWANIYGERRRSGGRQRQAIEMLKLRELSLKEAAAASGLTIAALKVAVHRGRKALRRALGAEV